MKNQNNEHAILKEPSTDSMLGDFFHEELKDLYRAEMYVEKTLPVMKMAASCGELVAAFESYHEQTREHLARLEDVFNMLGHVPQPKKCEAMEGLAKEAQRVIDETAAGSATRDTGLIMAAQKIEHYEIAAYGCLHKVAVSAGFDEVAAVLQTILSEKKEADKILTFIAENHIDYEPVIEE